MNRVRFLMILYVGALVLVSAGAWLRFAEWNLEDGYIVFRIVRNIVQHGEWAFNLGEIHNASTSVLNTLVLSLMAWTGLAIPMAAHLIGSLYLFCTALILFLSFRSVIGPLSACVLGFAAVLFLAHFHTWGFGLESYQFCLLLTAVVAMRHKPSWSFALSGLLVLSRPDAMLFVALLFLAECMRTRTFALRPLLITVAVCVPWTLYSIATFSQVFPDTLGNKMWQGRSGFWGSGLVYLQGLWQHLSDMRSGMPILTLLGCLGTLNLLYRRSAWALIPLFAIGQQFAYVVLNVPAYLWYFTTFDFAMLLSAGHLLGAWVQWISLRALTPGLFFGLQYAGASCAVLLGALYLNDSLNTPHSDSGNGHYVAAAQYIETATLPEGKLAALEVGTLGYLTQRPILDLIGLTSPNPEYLSGSHNDEFFRNPPALVLLHNPPWAMEEALINDPRFEYVYGRVEEQRVPHTPLSLFIQTRDPAALKDQNMEAFLRQEHEAVTEIKLGQRVFSPELQCVVDSLNGVLLAKLRTRRIAPGRLSLKGWVRHNAGRALQGQVRLVLLNPSRVLAMEARTFARPDVDAHFGRAEETTLGFAAIGHTLDAAKGGYEVALLVGEQLCATGTKVRLQ